MKQETVIQVGFDIWPGLNSRVREQLLGIYPDGNKSGPREFYCRLPSQDRRLCDILNALEASHLKPWRELDSKRSDEFIYGHAREYEPVELESFSLLQPMGNPDLHDYAGYDRESGCIIVKKRFFGRKHLLDLVDIDALLVSSNIRQQLEAEGFTGLDFVLSRPEEDDACVSEDSLWGLIPDQCLPPLSEYCTFFDQEGNQVKGSSEKGYQYREDFYGAPELHYRLSSLRDWSWPDFALTHELFRFAETRHRKKLVASQRFYQFCKAHKLKMDWIPVRIDPD